MSATLTRDQALELLHRHVQNPNLIKHSLAAAARLGADPERWGLAGLLHDLDVEETAGDMTRHGQESARRLTEAGLDPEGVEAVLLHNEQAAGRRRSTPFQHLLAAGETITGLITATALVYPDRKLAGVKVRSILKRMQEERFAASVNRATIRECEAAGVPLPEFAELALGAMQTIAPELGL